MAKDTAEYFQLNTTTQFWLIHYFNILQQNIINVCSSFFWQCILVVIYTCTTTNSPILFYLQSALCFFNQYWEPKSVLHLSQRYFVPPRWMFRCRLSVFKYLNFLSHPSIGQKKNFCKKWHLWSSIDSRECKSSLQTQHCI